MGRQRSVLIERLGSVSTVADGCRSVAGEFGDGLLGAGVVDELLVVSGGCDERCCRCVVERSGESAGDAVEAGDGVVSDEWFVAASEGEVVGEVVGGLAEVHGFDVEACGDALIEGSEDAHAELSVEGGLPDEDPGER